MYKGRLVWITGLVTTTAALPLFTAETPLSFSGNHAFAHDTGARSAHGWEALYRTHSPGYLIHGLQAPGDPLSEGTYQFDFVFSRRPGHLPNLLSGANDVVRLEAVDSTTGETLIDRTLQLADFKGSRLKRQIKSLRFSTVGRARHPIEPRVYWPGLCGIFLQHVDLVTLGKIAPEGLREKTDYFETMMARQFLDRGYVVVRDSRENAMDTGDAAIWTGLYAAEESWRFKKTRRPDALHQMEQSLWALHALFETASRAGTMVRYVDSRGHPLTQPASKDTYTGFFYAIAQGLAFVQDPRLRTALLADLAAAGNHFLDHDLSFVPADGDPVDLNPYPSPAFVNSALRSLQTDRPMRRSLAQAIRFMRWYFWIHGQSAPPSFSHFIKTLQHPSEAALRKALLPFLNDLRVALQKIEQNVHRSARRDVRKGLQGTPYGKLDALLSRALANLNADTHGQPLRSLSDLKILPSESLHALHMLKVAAELLPKPNRFDDYYRANLYEGKALLRTATQWHQFDEDLVTAALGQTEADTRRTSSAHLSFLALHDLILLEKNPAIRSVYEGLFQEQYLPMRSDGNAMIDAMQASMALPAPQMGLALWSLDRYPLDRRGKGERYWQENRKILLATFGGEVNHQARNPLPPDLRPRDAFLWQRSAHSIRGDQEGWLYPPLDYLFAYWLLNLKT